MLVCTGTTDKLQVVTGSAVTVDAHASFVDKTTATGAILAGRQNTAISTATTTDVVGAPGAGLERAVQDLCIHNKSAASSVVVTVQHTDGTTVVNMVDATLAAGEKLVYEDGAGWQALDANGAIKTATTGTGRWLKRTVLTAASGTFTTDPATKTITARLVAGGGAGAGCTSVASAASGGGGGGAGGYAEKTFAVTGNTGYAYTCGAAGAGASGGAGGNGGSTTLTVGATTVTAAAGQGAPVATALTTLSAYRGGAQSAASTNGDVNSAGDPGQAGLVLVVATPVGVSGAGASSPFGAGGTAVTAVGNGTAAAGFGAGGSGGLTGASVARTGGNGTAGCIVVDEYSA